MHISRLDRNLDALKLSNVFSEKQLVYVWRELDFLTNSSTMLTGDKTGSAKNADGEDTKRNRGVFLTDAYANMNISAIHNLLSIKVRNDDVYRIYQDIDDIHKGIRKIKTVSTLVSYYQDDDLYDWHEDDCSYSVVLYLYKEPKAFSGGEIKFFVNRSEYVYEVENNMAIVFPSSYLHSVNPVKMNGDYEELSGYGRYCISQFMGI
jgi:Rps23 Pro-64 3,4-dihydroxylase Tpa1-like proline 4-hydroxylase